MTNEHTSTSSAGSEDSPSQPMLPGMIPRSSASKTTTAPESSTDIGPMCQSSGTSGSSTAPSGEGQASSQVDFLANHSVKPGSKEARKMTVTSGLKCSALLKKQDPVGCLVKTLLESSRWHSTMCFLNWKAKGTPQGRLLFQLAPSTPRTDETESGLWPTPNVVQKEISIEEWEKKNTEKKAQNPNLGALQKSLFTAVDQAKKMWPTPTANEDAAGTPQGKMQPMLGNHPDVRNTGVGTLNPTWVEWLMGYPLGHTDLKPSETP